MTAPAPETSRPVRVELSIQGGFGPLALRPTHVVVEAATLDPADAAELGRLIAGARLPTQPARRVSGMPDVFTYRLAVVGPGGSDPIEFDDVSVPPEVRLLLDFVNRTGERTVP